MTHPANPPAPEGRLADLDDATLAELERLANALPANAWISESYWLGLCAGLGRGFGRLGDLARFLQLCSPERITQLVLAARKAAAIQPGDRELLRRTADYCDGVANRDTDTGRQLRAFADRLAPSPEGGAADA